MKYGWRCDRCGENGESETKEGRRADAEGHKLRHPRMRTLWICGALEVGTDGVARRPVLAEHFNNEKGAGR